MSPQCPASTPAGLLQDAEALRTQLMPDSKPWAILGQSFGGFCCVEYLSKFPSGAYPPTATRPPAPRRTPAAAALVSTASSCIAPAHAAVSQQQTRRPHAGVSECIMTGGIPPDIDSPCAADAVYTRTYHHVIKQNQKYYERFPQDVEKVKRIVRCVTSSAPPCGISSACPLPCWPSGTSWRSPPAASEPLPAIGSPPAACRSSAWEVRITPLCPPRLSTPIACVAHGRTHPRGRAVGVPSGSRERALHTEAAVPAALGGGGAGGGFERLHFIIDAAVDETQGAAELTPNFLKAFDAAIPFDTNPLYAVLHESCYTRGGATRWAAQRIRDSLFSEAFSPEVRPPRRGNTRSTRLRRLPPALVVSRLACAGAGRRKR